MHSLLLENIDFGKIVYERDGEKDKCRKNITLQSRPTEHIQLTELYDEATVMKAQNHTLNGLLVTGWPF